MKIKQVGLISMTILFGSTLLLVAVEKIIVGPSAKGAIDIEASVEDNLPAITKRLDREIENLLVAVEKSDFTGKCLLGFEKSNGVPDSMSTINSAVSSLIKTINHLPSRPSINSRASMQTSKDFWKHFRQRGQESEFGRGRRGPRSQDGEFGRSKRPKIGNRKIGKNHFGY